MLVTKNANCTQINIADQILTDFKSGAVTYSSVVAEVKHNNGTAVTLTILVGDVDSENNFTFEPSDLGQETTFEDGIYCVTLLGTRTSSNIDTAFGAELVDCSLKCTLATKVWNSPEEMLYAKYEALKYFLTCSPCDCATATMLYNDLLCDLDLQTNPCGC